MRVILFMMFCLACTAARSESLFTFSNTPGQHGVGMRVVKQYDRTRTFTPQQGMLAKRVLQTGEPGPADANGDLVSGGKGRPGRQV